MDLRLWLLVVIVFAIGLPALGFWMDYRRKQRALREHHEWTLRMGQSITAYQRTDIVHTYLGLCIWLEKATTVHFVDGRWFCSCGRTGYWKVY